MGENTLILPLTEVDEYGAVELAKAVAGAARRGIATIRPMSLIDGASANSGFDVTIDTNQFEYPPIFTFEIGDKGIRLHVHGTAGELAVTVQIHDDGSIELHRH
jgi:hypothetical protein